MLKPPKILVVANNKGGVGKSLISQLLATHLAFKKNLKGMRSGNYGLRDLVCF